MEARQVVTSYHNAWTSGDMAAARVYLADDLDFQGITEIGPAFADEIFRVFQLEHPDINVFALNTTPEVKKMIDRIRYPLFSSNDPDQLNLFSE